MPDNEAAAQPPETNNEATGEASADAETPTAAAGANGGPEDTDGKPPEGKPEEFDAKRAKEKIRKANSEAEGLRKRLKELEPLAAKAKQIEDAQKTEAERLQAQLAEREQQITDLRQRAVRSEVRALAASAFADPTDAVALLDPLSYIGDDGEIDTAQITSDLAELLERKPHLGKPKPEPERRRPAPDRTQASGANRSRIQNPQDDFASFIQTRLKRR